MKPTFHHRAVNDPFGDPSVFVRVLRERSAYLFDCGDLSALAVRDLMKLEHVFITHTHIDHFIGFDTVIRALLRRSRPVAIYGPKGIISNIEGKLSGYAWNLISEYPLEVHVTEIGEDNFEFASFRAREMFRRSDERKMDANGPVLDTRFLTVRYVVLDHDIPVLGYSINEKVHINIDKAALERRGLSVGPWLNLFKDSIRNDRMQDVMDTGSGEYEVASLKDVYTITRGQKISYIMDSAPSTDNIGKIEDFVAGSDSLYIESYFMHRDIEHARERKHLTALIAGRIARKAGVRSLHLLHISPRYTECRDDLLAEAGKQLRH